VARRYAPTRWTIARARSLRLIAKTMYSPIGTVTCTARRTRDGRNAPTRGGRTIWIQIVTEPRRNRIEAHPRQTATDRVTGKTIPASNLIVVTIQGSAVTSVPRTLIAHAVAVVEAAAGDAADFAVIWGLTPMGIRRCRPGCAVVLRGPCRSGRRFRRARYRPSTGHP
jgi:hypothetical protein